MTERRVPRVANIEDINDVATPTPDIKGRVVQVNRIDNKIYEVVGMM